MGIRADFYVGRGKSAEWIGSIAWDGYRDGIDKQILNCGSEGAFRHAVSAFLASRDDAIYPKDGWPWPWDDSSTTDCSYWFFDDRTWDVHTDFRGDDWRKNKREVYAPCDTAYIDDEQDGYAAFIEGLEAVTDMPNFSGQYNGGGAGFITITAHTRQRNS